jgi:uncharacterized membrane protein
MTMWFFTAILSALLFGLAGFIMKYGSAKKGSILHLLCGLYFSGSIGFLVVALLTGGLQVSLYIVIAGLIVGIGSTLGNLYFMKALDYGPASLTSPLTNTNLILVVMMSIFMYGESLSYIEIFAVFIIILSVSLIPFDPNESLSIHNKAWYGLVGISIILFFFRNGGLKITEELGFSNTTVLFYGYLFGVVWTGLHLLKNKRDLKVVPTSLSIRIGWICGIITGVFSFAGMQLYAHALAIGPASIVSPIFATNSLVVALLSILWFKERLSKLQVVALIGTVIGIILFRI